MKRYLALTLLYSIALTLCFTPKAPGQETTGTMSGSVSDPSGAMVPRATVTIKNEGTGLTRTVTTNDAGFYTAPNLPVGSYSVSAMASGFKTAEHTGIDLHVLEQKVVPVVLEVGTAVQTVEVTGGATLVETRTGEISNLVGAQQVSELPLNGRSFVQLTLLVPGAAAGDNQNSRFTGLLGGVDISMSGNSANANAWLVDGVDNVDHGSGRTILIYPSVDSIEEFKVQRNSYGADSPAAGGAQISLVTKSGTNRLHGSVYEFFRNDKLDAANFFLNAANKQKAPLRYNDFGYSLGGPIKKDKAFFFWSQEWRREIRGITRRAQVPTDLERQGNFSGPDAHGWPTPTDPYNFTSKVDTTPGPNFGKIINTPQPFPNNTIPACATGQTTDCLSPAGLAVLQLYPKQNTPIPAGGGYNWVFPVGTRLPTREEQIRGDYNVNDKTSVMVRYTQDSWKNPAPNFGSDGGLWGDTGFPTVDSSWAQPSKAFATRLTHTFGASTINEFQFSYSNNRIYITEGIGKDINNAINAAIPQIFPVSSDRAHAVFWTPPENVPTGGLWNAAPWNNAHDIFVWKDDLTHVHGNHSLKFGAFFSHDKKDEDCCGASNLSTQFWGPTAVPGGAGANSGTNLENGGWGPAAAPGAGSQVTGSGLADLLLQGAYWGSSPDVNTQPRSKVRWDDIESYVADTWRVRPRLTLDLGVRWSILPPSIQADDKLANFVPSLYNPSVGSKDPTNGLIFPTSVVNTALGITGGKANLRGIDVGRALRNSRYDTIAPRIGIAWDPTGAGKWAIRAGAGVFFGRADLSQPIGELISNPPFEATANWPGTARPLDYLPGPVPGAAYGTAQNAADINWKVQGSYQWNFTVEREIARDTKLQVGYLGNKGNHLPLNYDLNSVTPANWLQFETIHNTVGHTTGDEDKLRPLYALRGSSDLIFQTNGGNSIYHSLQVFLSKRFANNYSFQVAYTFSRNLADSSLSCCGNGNGRQRLTTPFFPKYDRGLADFDRTHIFTANWIYRFSALPNRSALVRGVAGGWEATGIYSYSSGVPLGVATNQNELGVDSNKQIRPDQVVSSVTGPHNANQWINQNSFAFPVQFGRLGYSSVSSFRAPPLNGMDFAIYKNFPLHWESTSIQLRFETFNTLNHTQFQDVDTSYQVNNLKSDVTKGVFTSCSTINGNVFPFCNTNPTFGQVEKARDPREIQIALKFIF